MTDVRDAMIVAGGAGTRLWPLTATTPKPLLPFCAAPFLVGVLQRLAAVGIDRVLLVVGADTRPFDALRGDADAAGIALEVVPEPQPLDTAGGVRAALDRVRGSFLVLNGDILTDLDLRLPIDAHRRTRAAATLVLTRVEDTSTFGVCVLDGTRIAGFVEKPARGTLPGQNAVNAGTYVLEPEVLERFPQGPLSFERTVFPELVASGAHVEGLVSDAVWADLGTPERVLHGHRLALDGVLRWPTLAAVPADARGQRIDATAVLDPTARVIGPVLLGPGSHVGPGAVVGPHVVLEHGARIGPRARLSDAVIGRATVVGADGRLRALLTGSDARLGDGLVVDGPVVLGDGVRVPAHTTLGPGATVPERPSAAR